MREDHPSEGFRRGEEKKTFSTVFFICFIADFYFSLFILPFCQVKIEVFQLVKQEVLSQGEEGEGDENEEEAGLGGILNLEQEWL